MRAVLQRIAPAMLLLSTSRLIRHQRRPGAWRRQTLATAARSSRLLVLLLLLNDDNTQAWGRGTYSSTEQQCSAKRTPLTLCSNTDAASNAWPQLQKS